MATSKHPSAYNFLKGSLEFTDEPLWFRLVLWISLLLFYTALAVILAHCALPALAVRWIRRLPGLKGWPNRMKGSP